MGYMDQECIHGFETFCWNAWIASPVIWHFKTGLHIKGRGIFSMFSSFCARVGLPWLIWENTEVCSAAGSHNFLSYDIIWDFCAIIPLTFTRAFLILSPWLLGLLPLSQPRKMKFVRNTHLKNIFLIFLFDFAFNKVAVESYYNLY